MMISTDYSDTTPDVTLTYDSFGRPLTQSNGLATTTYTYNPATLALTSETIAYDWDTDGTPELTRVLDRTQDNLQRDTGWQLKGSAGVPPAFFTENSVEYQYSPTDGRLASVNRGSDSFSYLYAPGSSLVATVTSPVHTVSNVYDTTRNVLTTKENKVATTNISTYQYGVNSIGQRSDVSQTGTAFATTRSTMWVTIPSAKSSKPTPPSPPNPAPTNTTQSATA